jgi:hypothetical protein
VTTLIAVYNSDGCVGRCDANCYEAKHQACDCICGGRNHGAGLDKARDNTRELADTWLKDFAARKGLADYEGLIGMTVAQGDLFGGEGAR